MEIDPVILVPGAAVAVLLMILYIRLVIGRREALLEEAEVTAFLRLQAPDLTLDRLLISADRKSALVFWRDQQAIGLVRSFGNKFVLQSIAETTLRPSTNEVVHIPRQGLAHPPLDFRPAEKGAVSLALSEASRS